MDRRLSNTANPIVPTATEEPNRTKPGERADDAVGIPLVRTLLGISRSVRALAEIALRDAGLHPGQDALLLALATGGRLSVHQAAEVLVVRPSTVSNMVDILAAKGLVVKSTDPLDARRVVIALTAAGVAVQSRITAAHAALAADLDLAGEGPGLAAVLARMDKVLTARLRRSR